MARYSDDVGELALILTQHDELYVLYEQGEIQGLSSRLIPRILREHFGT